MLCLQKPCVKADFLDNETVFLNLHIAGISKVTGPVSVLSGM